MKDDIRTSVKKSKPADIELPESELVQPPEEVIKSFGHVNDQPSSLEAREDGFVVLPEHGDVHPKKFKNPFAKISELPKKQKIIFWVIVGIVVLGLGGGAYALLKPKPAPATKAPEPITQKVEEPPKPTTEASKLSGLQVPIGTNKKPVVSIQIENSPDARPQSGLNEASVVFEAIAEGGITRFNASFLDNQPNYIGPIRSVRPYYAQLAAPFDPIFVHAGGSGAGLAKLSSLGLKDLDHGANGSAFQRVSDRYAPHNLYSSMSALLKASEDRGYTKSDTKSFLRKEEKKADTATATKIDMNISGPLYNTHYDYDAKTNSYKRSMAGAPHKDAKSGKQLTPKVVIAIVTSWGQDGIYSVYGIPGKGTAFIFQDGIVQKVSWAKKSDKAQIVFTDAKGKELGINPGQTWVTLLGAQNEVSYTP